MQSLRMSPRPEEYRFGLRKRKIHLKGGDSRVFLSGPRPTSAPVADRLCINPHSSDEAAILSALREISL
jgi:hypothetical protein